MVMRVAQAQKELTINESLALLDALLHPVVEGHADEPPAAAPEGQCWIVGAQPNGEWSGQAGQIACRQAGNWLFVQPVDGFCAFDRSTGGHVRFFGGWTGAVPLAAPDGGTTVDAEARDAIEQIIAALTASGMVLRA
ncbi:DUF2793 domain-containing protein [Aurantiacibacter hainanensis]|uniref:DUF2793 domain-containing protein n=1 Tax=Aurantiacibacter hainanensis TaxID=3076114 RepID=UPI0030C6D65C